MKRTSELVKKPFSVLIGVSLLIESVKPLALLKAKQKTEGLSKQGNLIFSFVFSFDYHSLYAYRQQLGLRV